MRCGGASRRKRNETTSCSCLQRLQNLQRGQRYPRLKVDGKPRWSPKLKFGEMAKQGNQRLELKEKSPISTTPAQSPSYTGWRRHDTDTLRGRDLTQHEAAQTDGVQFELGHHRRVQSSGGREQADLEFRVFFVRFWAAGPISNAWERP